VEGSSSRPARALIEEGETGRLLADTRLKIAVFIDFDNIEIGVKSTLGVQFDIGVVLEALKERGDVVSKIAYGDWTRAGDYSRSLTQHATKLVQRNLTPGGDKNGADINLALDALEMAFTHSHINAYVIVGGDSDFISLVEKLKQYDKQIFVVGGRAFTSLVMQRNCHEFIAYENLVSSRRFQDRGQKSTPSTTQQAPLDQVLPLVRRALKVLTDREVTPQLGLLKSTLLQLDSTFSERTYGAGSFRDFAQKLAAAGHVVLREAGRNVLVELSDTVPVNPSTGSGQAPSTSSGPSTGSWQGSEASPREAQPSADPVIRDAAVPTNGSGRAADGIREIRRLFQSAQRPPRWPMYIRQLKQYLRAVDATFDERKYGFETLGDLMRACQRDGLLRIERDRQGGMRIFPGTLTPPAVGDAAPVQDDGDVNGSVAEPAESAESFDRGWTAPVESSSEADVVEGDVLQEIEVSQVLDAEESPAPPEKPSRRRPRAAKAARPGGEARTARKPAQASPARNDHDAPAKPRKPAARPRSTRSRTRTDASHE
jgi:uncharacterized LabA/DUF88 family protein